MAIKETDIDPASPTRVEIESLIKSIADDCAFTMPFWLAGLLVNECRRQGLHTCGYDGDDFRVTVIIKRKDRRTQNSPTGAEPVR